jgi:hypothetical protein
MRARGWWVQQNSEGFGANPAYGRLAAPIGLAIPGSIGGDLQHWVVEQRPSACYRFPNSIHLPSRRQKQMAKRASFNLSETIREFQKSHGGVPATAALAAVKKAHPSQKINDGTFKATFYKIAGGGKKKTVRRRKPGRFVPGHGSPEHIMKAGLHFIMAAGGVEEARERLVGLAELIETAKAVE